MKLSEIHKKFKQLTGYYGGQPPISVLTSVTGLSQEDTVALWKEYIETLPPEEAPKPRKRGPKPKTQPVKRTPKIKPAEKLATNGAEFILGTETKYKPEATPVVTPEEKHISFDNDINVGSKVEPPSKPSKLSWFILKVSAVTYGILVATEMIVSFFSMFSIGENQLLRIVLGILGVVITFVAITMYLRGANTKGPERYILWAFWLIYVILSSALNWAWMVSNLENGWKESQRIIQYRAQDEATYDANENAIREIERKVNSTNQWVAGYADIVKSYNDQKLVLITQNEKIREKLNKTEETSSLGIFTTMGSLLGWEGIQTSKIWYLLFLILMQGLIVLTVPRNKS